MTSKLSQSLLLVPLTAASVQVSGELSLSRRRGYKYSPVRGRHGARWVWEGGLQGRNRQENWLKAYLLIRWGGGGGAATQLLVYNEEPRRPWTHKPVRPNVQSRWTWALFSRKINAKIYNEMALLGGWTQRNFDCLLLSLKSSTSAAFSSAWEQQQEMIVIVLVYIVHAVVVTLRCSKHHFSESRYR